MSLINNKKLYVITSIIIIVGVFYVGYLRAVAPTSNSNGSAKTGVLENGAIKNYKTIQIGRATIQAELATTEAQQVQGLSGRTSLATSTGMLFVFDRADKWGIWMKDMNFPIDVLWIDSNLKVNYIVENMTPASYPTTYWPQTPASYVLEIPVGTIKSDGISVGQSVVLK
ncbi:TPA: hypothetical protein DCQ44_03135 [Candidatus Taylorbacteria bacterium]|nr:hypothetical protein [Candidatus Taylorbacteria bacterium]